MKQEFRFSQKLFSPKSLRIGVVCGGKSSERQVSLRSGGAILKALRQTGVRVKSLDPARPGFLTQAKSHDILFLALHGTGGEDGTIQKALDQKKVLYTGSDAKASAIAFDKLKTKRILKKYSLPVVDFHVIDKSNWKRIVLSQPFPSFVKPLKEGSSIGVCQLKTAQDAFKMIPPLLRKYRILLHEKNLSGGEYTVGVLGKKPLPVVEMRPKGEFYDYKCKYTKGMTEYLVPAPISDKLRKKLQSLAVICHQRLGLRDISRVDFKLDDKGRPFILEANSIPGFTELSLLPKAAIYAGIPFPELCLLILKMAWKRRK